MLETVVGLSAAVLLALFGLVILVRLWVVSNSRGNVGRWVLLSFAIHLTLACVIWNSSLRSPDGELYHQLAAGFGPGRSGTTIAAGKEGYVFLLGWLYRLFGTHIGVALILSAFLGAALAPIVFDTTFRLFGSRAARYSVPLIVLWPSLVFWSSQPLREGAIHSLIALAMNMTVRIRTSFAMAPVLGLVGALAALATFRSYIAIVCATALAAGLILSAERLASRLRLLLMVTVAILPLYPLATNYEGTATTLSSNLDDVAVVRAGNARTAESGYGTKETISTPTELFRYLPAALPQATFGPPVWTASSVVVALGSVDGALWVLTVVALIRIARRGLMRIAWIPVIPTASILLVLAVLAGNYGAVVRLRCQAFVLIAPLLALAIERRRSRGMPTRLLLPEEGHSTRVTAGLSTHPTGVALP